MGAQWAHEKSRTLVLGGAVRAVRQTLEPVILKCCTEKQREALALYAAGYSLRQISLMLGIGKTAVRDRVDTGLMNVRRELYS
jgi:DNA-directed RNA polymerase specialized sigma24 family protein